MTNIVTKPEMRREISRRTYNRVRAEEHMARWCGDEFIVLFENVSHTEIEQKRLREQIETPIRFERLCASASPLAWPLTRNMALI